MSTEALDEERLLDEQLLAKYIPDPARRLESLKRLHSAKLRPLLILPDTTQTVTDVFERWNFDLPTFVDDILDRRKRFRPAICAAIKMVERTIGKPLGIAAATGCALMLDAEMTQAEAADPTDITGQPILSPIMVVPMDIMDHNNPSKLSAAFRSEISITRQPSIIKDKLEDDQLLKDMLRPCEDFLNLVSVVMCGELRREVPTEHVLQSESIFGRSMLNYTRVRLDHLHRFDFQ